MTKSTITRERAQQIFLGNGPEPSASEERELARMALAAMGSETAIADCDPEVYEKGVSVCLVAIPKETAEVICQNITAATGCKVDWHYFGGRVHIKALRVASQPAKTVQPVMFIDGDISSEDADKLAKVIREFNEEDERPLAKMARIIRENPHPTNECDMPKAQPAPVVPGKWIPVSERMPEDRTQVILWDAEIGEVTSGHYSHKTQTFYHCGDAIENEITHWMLPPSAPQGVKP
ncbi:TPA: DUF551 domain-containing protein [Klebsiella variicola subsp. variicola]|nr:DUF551 domain-containing protein [Klebsiella variicola subsp. variicola]